MEAEIIRMTLDLYNGDSNACGLVTSGGTESLFLAMLAYREQGRKKGITRPNVVCSQATHVAIDKAAFYLNMEVRKVPMLEDFSCNIHGIIQEIDSNTVCIIGSAPEYPFGRYDPMP